MTNLQSIAGGVAWMFTALVLIAATFEPVSTTEAPAETRVAALCLDAGGTARSCPVYLA